jgi:hypothetical protein
MVFGHGSSNGAVAVILPDGQAVACVVTGTLGLSGWDTQDHSKLGKVEQVLGFWFMTVIDGTEAGAETASFRNSTAPRPGPRRHRSALRRP